MLRRLIITTTLILHALSGTADAADLRLRWIHEGAPEFVVVVDQPTSAQTSPLNVSLFDAQSDAEGWFEAVVSGIDPAYDADVHLVAINIDDVPGPPSNILHIPAVEFCGAATCADGLGCTHDVCGTGFCANTPDNDRCEDLNECTQNFCDLEQGCVHLATTGTCNDDLDCTVLDSCADGVCAGIPDCPPDTHCSKITGDCELGTTTTTTTSTTTTTTVPVTTTLPPPPSTTTTLPPTTLPPTTTTTTLPPSTLPASTTTTTTTTTTTLPPPACGDGRVDPDEQCDDGDEVYTPGDACTEHCLLVNCGDADGSGALSLIDALLILHAALGTGDCSLAVCNVDSNLDIITASDALRLLRVIVGFPIELRCPSLDETPTNP